MLHRLFGMNFMNKKPIEIKSNNNNTIFSNEENIIENEFFLPKETELFTSPEKNTNKHNSNDKW